LEAKTNRVFRPDGVELSVSGSARDLLRRLIEGHKGEKISAGQALNHAWFRKFLPEAPKVRLPPTLSEGIETFCMHSRLKKAALYLIADRSPSQHIQEFRDAFQYFDTDMDGLISPYDVEKGLVKFERPVPADLLVHLREADVDGVGVLDYTAFIAVCLGATDLCKGKAAVNLAFAHFDRDGDGLISREEVAACLSGKEVSGGLSPEEVVELVREVDQDNKGGISLKDLSNTMASGPMRNASRHSGALSRRLLDRGKISAAKRELQEACEQKRQAKDAKPRKHIIVSL